MVAERSIEERDQLPVECENAVGGRRRVWCVITSVEPKGETEACEQQAAGARKYATKVCDGILALMDGRVILSASTGEPKVFYDKTDVPEGTVEVARQEISVLTETIEEQAFKPDGGCAAQAPEWEELQRLRAEGLVAIRDINKLLNNCDELIPTWLNVVRGVVDSEDLPLNVYRETLLQNKILRVIKKNHVTKYLEKLAETAELKDDPKRSYEQRGKCSNLGYNEDSAVGVKTAELLRFNTSKSGGEQISIEEYVDRMTEEQYDIYYITGESIAMVSFSSLCENLRKKDHEVPYMADPVDEKTVHQPMEFDGMRPTSTTKEGLDLRDQDE